MSGGGLGDIIQAQISDLQVGGRKECVAAGKTRGWLGDGGGVEVEVAVKVNGARVRLV